jgi:tetratricopeptide (TPR) repeat protein
MFNVDERLRGLPASREQVVQLYQSLNAPHLAVPGRRAGPATGYVLGLRGPSGFAVFVYLYLAESGECAVYVPSAGTVSAEAYQAEEAEALSFVESMGFIMDNLNFRGRPPEEQEELIRTTPAFQREPPAPSSEIPGVPSTARPGTGKSPGVIVLGKLFASFCLALFLGAGCAHVSEKDREEAVIHYDLAVQNLVKNPPDAMKSVEKALNLNPGSAEAWHVKALLLHHAFGRLEEAQAAYGKALELLKPFPEARTNLGNLFMDEKRYDDAIAQYEQALNDVLNPAPFIAHANMGWAYFKKGDVAQAVDHLKASVTINPAFCLGHLQLGEIAESQGNARDACQYYKRFRSHCPDSADANERAGLCLQKEGDAAQALKAFDACLEKGSDDQKDRCRQARARLSK